MKLADVSIRRPVFAAMLMGSLVVLGLVSIPRLGLDLFPRVEFPVVTVTTLLDLTGFASVRALPAALPARPLPNLGFAALAALGTPPLSPSITVIARTGHGASSVRPGTSPLYKETTP